MTAEAKDTGLGSVHKALTLVAELATGAAPQRLGDLAARSGMTKPTVHRLLRSLTAAGYVRALGGGLYTVGPALIGVSAATVGGLKERPLIQRSLNELRTRTGLTASYAIRWGTSVIVIDNVEPDQAYRVSPRLGVRTPLAECAAGVAMLALDRHPGSDRDAAPAEAEAEAVERARRLGYAYDDEPRQGVRSVASGVARAGDETGALIVTGLGFNLNAETIEVVGALLAEQAALLSATLQAVLPAEGHAGNVGIA
ncbi:IclR family transcriptional regulator [Phytoactinopolyspora halotolerans]|uniref:Helix-turn-helix domain-containing protein n=1 Tax=Phytoactinopolyspora halotolerans TaxID=1981512 RepID=A0A6L9S334_9ACTN|nr:helix-turn-helix domain-containing protein [Phytoactinopolyspora halotolerans]NED99240.1 helix-turn-helix domain-containing protein [Phytoactinopolyspora halotolerans]